ncbi:MAG: hypothetical protein M1820_009205 [Bogoriella megaspora]|nr:MAG: hypothetical protein M1820_009205 [Bogoriella megaspora]
MDLQKFNFLFLFTLLLQITNLVIGRDVSLQAKSEKRQTLQDLVTWDETSLFVRGERIFIFSGEFHPFRLPVTDLWRDIFQKIKALGFSGVSFYTDWGLHEGNRGHVVTDGIWSLDKFFQAASETGIYLIARPGPYINAETAAGGFPGWTLRLNATLRSANPVYLNVTDNYMSTLGKIIADAQITNGGPMNREVMQYAEDQLHDAGVVVPLIVNDNLVAGYFAPGTGLGAVDIYGIDAYPLRANPYVWPTIRFPTGWQITHQRESPTTPFAIAEFQGGTGTGWGAVGQDQCAILVNNQAERVLYKNNYSFGVKIFNVYMLYGGTNWGNLGYFGGTTSYDYGAAITEDRLVWREKYSELKLEANFLKVSPAYLTATPGNETNGTYASTSEIGVTPLFGNGSNTNFYVVRHADFTSNETTEYRLTVSTSAGNLTLPQLGGSLTLFGRDSKIHVTDYDVGGTNVLYSTAEVYTWTNTTGRKRVLVLYGGAGETHEAAFSSSYYILHWDVDPERKVVQIGDLEVHLLWRNEAYNYWVLELPAPAPISNYTSPSKGLAIIKAGYLLRSASILGSELSLTGDTNATTDIEVISVPQTNVTSISFNGERLSSTRSTAGRLTATISYPPPTLSIPSLSALQWKYIDSLPETRSTYDDTLWTVCNQTISFANRTLTTPTSLYASDYGYHAGSLLYRGHFTSQGNESSVFLNITGGYGFAHSVWLNDTFLGSWVGSGANQTVMQTFLFPSALQSGSSYVINVLIDHTGQDEEGPGTDAIKFPRGILDYSVSGRQATDITWKMTGNLGGEQYKDLARGPRNEGAMFAERNGYHLPNLPSDDWAVANPVTDGIESAGVGFYATNFDLNVPSGWDVAMSFVFNGISGNGNGTAVTQRALDYRVQLFVNGYQFGKYVNNLGPETAFPVPEGILNHNGRNDVAVTLWALDKQGANIGGLALVPQRYIKSGYLKPGLSPMPAWTERQGAY